MPDRYENLAVDQLRTDLGTHGRVRVDADTVKKYVAALADSARRPEDDPVVAFYDKDSKQYALASGFHWVSALRAREGGKSKIRVLVKDGNVQDAIDYAVSECDHTHGLPLSSDDKRHRVKMLLGLDRYKDASTKLIADKCHVSQALVKDVRESTSHSRGSERRTGKDGRQRPAKAKPRPSKNGSVVFDWKAYMAVYGGLMRQVDVLGNAYHCKESLDAKGLRRLLSEWHRRFKKLYSQHSKQKAPVD